MTDKNNNGLNDGEDQQPKDNKFNLFTDSIWNVTKFDMVTLSNVFERITTDRYKAITAKVRAARKDKITDEKDSPYSVLKSSTLDYVTFNGELKIVPDLDKSGKQKIDKSGELKFTARCEAALDKLSGYFIIDIDHLTPDRLTALKEDLQQDAKLGIQLMFISPGGDGLKIVVKIDTALVDLTLISAKMGNYWAAFNQYFAQTYADLITPNKKGEFIDGACKDVSRACFLCHNHEAYLNINDTVHGQSFLNEYKPVEKESTASKKQAKKVDTKTVNPATTLEDLAARHLMEVENHHPELRAFIGAAKSIGTPIEHTLNFINNYVHISQQSAHSTPSSLEDLANDIYTRYGTDNEGIVYLTPLSFSYDVLQFKYVKDIKQFVVSTLYWTEIRNILQKAGFAKRKIGGNFLYIQTNGCFIKEVIPEMMRDYLTGYIYSIKDGFSFSYQNILYQIPLAIITETYLKNSNNIFNDVWLEHLEIHSEPILKDTANEIFFPFQNCLATVSKDGIKTEVWQNKTGVCIWEDQLIKHDFEFIEDFKQSKFYSFLTNVTNNETSRMNTMLTGIGYLLHHHFKESEGQAVCFYDQTITDTSKPMGGSGKGLIVNAIKQVKAVVKVDGKHLDPGNKFKWEMVTPSTQVAWIDDVKPDFDFGLLHSNLTDGWTIERKYLSQFLIKPEDSPKTTICSNSIIKGNGTTNKRRQFIIELSDFYSRQIINGDEKPIEQTHGGLFFSRTDWPANEWNLFFSVMLNAGYQYLNHGLIHHAGINVEVNRFRQATDEDFAAWVMEQDFEAKKQYATKDYYSRFVSIYYGDSHQIGQRKFTGYLKEYASFKKWNFDVLQSGCISYFQFKQYLSI